MGWKPNPKRGETHIIQNTDSGMGWQAIVGLIASVVLGIPMVILAVKACGFIEREHVLLILGALFGLGFFVAATLCWTRVVIAYSQLRSREDEADDKREMDFLKTFAMLTGSGRGPSIDLRGLNSGMPGQGQGWPSEVGPGGQPAYRPPVIDYNEPTELE